MRNLLYWAGGPGSRPGQSVRDLWRKKWHCVRFFSKFFGVFLSISFHRGSKFICLLLDKECGSKFICLLLDKEWTYWWPQFKDIVYPIVMNNNYTKQISRQANSHSANQEMSRLYGALAFITVFTRAGHCFLSWARWVQLKLLHTTSYLLQYYPSIYV
jgi:hypothetical protein